MRKPTKDAKYVGRETKTGSWSVFESGKPAAVAGPFKTPEECTKWIKEKESSTKDAALGELQSKRKKLEEEFDKADDSGDNRALDRIRRELKNIDQQIEAEKKTTKDDSANANGRKLIKTVTGSKSSCKVYFDKDWDEYQCELFINGVWQKNATYHDNDKGEALSTAEAMVKRAEG